MRSWKLLCTTERKVYYVQVTVPSRSYGGLLFCATTYTGTGGTFVQQLVVVALLLCM
jgi:hypothetical protein